MRVAHWYYEQPPEWPERYGGQAFNHRSLYFEIIKIVQENPGIATADIVRKIGKPYTQVAPLIFHLKRFGALKKKMDGYERTPGLNEFAKLPSVQKMLSKLSSEKTKGPWLRRLFRYQQWLAQKKYFKSVEQMLESYRKARTEEKKYQHVDMIKANRGSPLTNEDREFNRFLAKVRAPVEHPYAVIKRVFHAGRVRVTTIVRTNVILTFVCTCYNLFRALELATMKGR